MSWTDSFYEDRFDPTSHNYLAEYLLHHARRLESLETNWFPIFVDKQCLPRLACMSLYYGAANWMFEGPFATGLPREWYDSPLARNVRRLRAGLREHVLDERRVATKERLAMAGDHKKAVFPVARHWRKCTAARPSHQLLCAQDVVDTASSCPFEKSETWSEWLSDQELMEKVARAFNVCPWALEEDLPPNPEKGYYEGKRWRSEWPLSPYKRSHARLLQTNSAEHPW